MGEFLHLHVEAEVNWQVIASETVEGWSLWWIHNFRCYCCLIDSLLQLF